MEHKGTARLETERLILRRFTVEDAQDMFDNWAHDPEVAKYVTWAPHPDAAATKELLTLWSAQAEEMDTYNWCIVWKQSGEAIGNISVVRLHERAETAEIGYCLSARFWGQGIMTEAFRAVIAYLFTCVGVNRIEARHDTRNPASGRVMEKCGMTKEGVLRQRERNNAGRCDLAIYSILREEWQ